ncbi:MAG: LamG domain-containing protein [bacterium]|nr:LamG domain-containing protein [bacterium]
MYDINKKIRMRLVKDFLVVFLLSAFTFSSLASAEEGLVGCWNFDEGKGDIAKDSSDNKKDGKISGNPQWVKQDKGYALSFDGIDDEVTISNAPVFFPSDNWTVSFWSKIDPAQTSWQGVICFKSGAAWGIYACHPYTASHPNTAFLYTAGEKHTGATAIYFPTKEILGLGNWKYYTLTKSGSIYRWYIDGDNYASQDKGKGDVTMNTSSTWKIGFKYMNRYKGTIDEVMVYNRALTAQEIKKHYEAGSWRVEEGSEFGIF